MDSILETERLRIRRFTLEDAGFILELLNSPGWLKYIGDRNVKTEAQAKAYLQHGPLKSYEQYGYGLAMVETKADSIALGMCGIIKRYFLEHPDIGFAFLPDYTGKGYAFEAASATLVYAKETLNLHVITAITLAENANSIRLLEKIGLRYANKITYPGTEEELLLYSS